MIPSSLKDEVRAMVKEMERENGPSSTWDAASRYWAEKLSALLGKHEAPAPEAVETEGGTGWQPKNKFVAPSSVLTIELRARIDEIEWYLNIPAYSSKPDRAWMLERRAAYREQLAAQPAAAPMPIIVDTEAKRQAANEALSEIGIYIAPPSKKAGQE